MSIIKEVIYDVITAVLVLSLIVMVLIPVYRNNVEIVSATAGKAGDLEKIEEQIFIPIDKNIVKGCDVISTIRYYKADPGVEILVNRANGTSKIFIVENYDPGVFYIPAENEFGQACYYQGKNLKKIIYTQK